MATIQLTKENFIAEVFDFENEQEWKYRGDVPAIIDFYADWCAPCRMVAPLLEELSVEYEGKIRVYKVNTEKEMELSELFGIRSIPSFLFIPMEGMPMMQPGAFPKKVFKEVIEDRLLKMPVTEDTE